MNPFDKIASLKTSLLEEAKCNGVNLDDTITYREHYQKMLNMLNIVNIELESARYNFAVERFGNQQIHVFDEMTVSSLQLEDGMLLFQPVSNNGNDVTACDMQSLYNTLAMAYDNGYIKQSMIVLPPGVNVFYARLERPANDNEE